MTTFTEYAKAAAARRRAEAQAQAQSELNAHVERVCDAAHDWLWKLVRPFDANANLDLNDMPQAMGQWQVVYDVALGTDGDEQRLFIAVTVPHNGDQVSRDGRYVGHVIPWDEEHETWLPHWTDQHRKQLQFTDLAELGRVFEWIESRAHLTVEMPKEDA